MSRFRINRRQLLGAAASTAFAGAMLSHKASATAGAAGPISDEAASATSNQAASRLALLDGMLTGDDLAHARAALASPQPQLLEPDLLWQWRRGLAQQLGNGVRAIAITRWDKAIVLKGLAREAALPVRQQRIGRSLFQTEIG
jgi:hypothetical protein